MKALILLVPFIVLAAVWFAVVRYRGRIPKSTAHWIGVVAGVVLGILALSAALPKPTEAELASREQARVAEQVAQDAKAAEQKRLQAIAAEIESRQVPREAIDRITLIYLNHKIYANNPVVCTSQVFGGRSMVACRAQMMGGYSAPHVWLYEGGKFKSINGTARGLAETKLSNERDIELSKLPLPVDIDVSAAVESFSKG